MGATLMCAQRFFESPTVCAYLLTMLVVGLLLDAIMLRIRMRIPPGHPDSDGPWPERLGDPGFLIGVS